MQLFGVPGVPDKPEKGLPNPLLITIYQKYVTAHEILQHIFYFTFMQIESFEKLRLPVPIEVNNEQKNINRRTKVKFSD